MREVSKEMDMSSYIANLPSSFSIENIETLQNKEFDYSFDNIDAYDIIEYLNYHYEWCPSRPIFN